MLSWIPRDIDLILLVETWEHDKSRVPHLNRFILWSIWNKKYCWRGLGGIAYYIRNIVSSHIRLHKIDPFNQYIWIDIFDSNIRKNLDKNRHFNTLEKDIHNVRNEGNILLFGDFNARIVTNQAIMLNNNSNPDPLWLDEDGNLANRFKRNFEYINENLFDTELLKLCSS